MRKRTDPWSTCTWKQKATLLSYRRGKTCLKGHPFRQEETVGKDAGQKGAGSLHVLAKRVSVNSGVFFFTATKSVICRRHRDRDVRIC